MGARDNQTDSIRHGLAIQRSGAVRTVLMRLIGHSRGATLHQQCDQTATGSARKCIDVAHHGIVAVRYAKVWAVHRWYACARHEYRVVACRAAGPAHQTLTEVRWRSPCRSARAATGHPSAASGRSDRRPASPPLSTRLDTLRPRIAAAGQRACVATRIRSARTAYRTPDASCSVKGKTRGPCNSPAEPQWNDRTPLATTRGNDAADYTHLSRRKIFWSGVSAIR